MVITETHTIFALPKPFLTLIAVFPIASNFWKTIVYFSITVIVLPVADFFRKRPALPTRVQQAFISCSIAIIVLPVADFFRKRPAFVAIVDEKLIHFSIAVVVQPITDFGGRADIIALRPLAVCAGLLPGNALAGVGAAGTAEAVHLSIAVVVQPVAELRSAGVDLAGIIVAVVAANRGADLGRMAVLVTVQRQVCAGRRGCVAGFLQTSAIAIRTVARHGAGRRADTAAFRRIADHAEIATAVERLECAGTHLFVKGIICAVHAVVAGFRFALGFGLRLSLGLFAFRFGFCFGLAFVTVAAPASAGEHGQAKRECQH
ncbi:hypothetical protein A3H11_04365 [Candidatus Uhrbacteria bacterium RIFCSPLOWO2_12_FULL_47_10]|nr:MAG: hypothetical protein A2753_00790 [Candidatus Uhrbacteria bacterium RIFCSPHIGHO2_01_FULL_47_11]OGL68090.1 MAG: hypothetical protein A3D58_00780 [Candidatus Uhrbacteria bacterium RIFCSPHIGHO2_02_FULL_46_47]OGL92679.1 MAG: hypothetical protein A3H11_04365 [Candidatus Uhrbacteria bacterium RIFCSPLOWO2_12_FULL_47_10]